MTDSQNDQAPNSDLISIEDLEALKEDLTARCDRITARLDSLLGTINE